MYELVATVISRTDVVSFRSRSDRTLARTPYDSMATAPQRSSTQQSTVAAFPADGSLADLVQFLGGIPASRIRLLPTLGTATVADAQRINEQKERLVELEHGMEMKLRRYFEAGVLLVWYIDPSARTARAFTCPTDVSDVDRGGQLDGGDVLPGFTLSLTELFEKADRQFAKELRKNNLGAIQSSHHAPS